MGNYVTGTRRANAPDTVVWDLLTDVERWPERFASHLQAASLDGPVEPGTTGWVRIKKPRMTSGFEVADVVPGRSWSWVGKVMWLDLTFDHIVEPTEAGAKVTFDADLDGPLAFVMRPLLRPLYRRQMETALDNLVDSAQKQVGRTD